jgi:hypothetical protein
MAGAKEGWARTPTGGASNPAFKPSSVATEALPPFTVSTPRLELLKGGGAIRGIAEKIGASPIDGTGALSVPIATNPGRSGFAPQLSLNYGFGAGNEPFGFGWSRSLPAITRKTEKGLPQYRVAEKLDDVYLLSGADDLVAVLDAVGRRHSDDTTFPGYIVQRYRPGVEGLFAPIERWTNVGSNVVHWRSITRDNITSIFGKDSQSRVFESADQDQGK